MHLGNIQTNVFYYLIGDIVVPAVCSLLLPGIKFKSLQSFVYFSVLLILGDLLMQVFNEPLLIIAVPTLGIGYFILKAGIIILIAKYLKDITIKNFWWALLLAVLSILLTGIFVSPTHTSSLIY